MAEKIVSPGVFTKEIDVSFLPAAIGEIGAAIIGPTVKGPGMIPTVINSYSEYQEKFGDSFTSGSNTYQYLTSHIAREYFTQGGGAATVVRIIDGTFSGASSNVPTGSGNYNTGSNVTDANDSSTPSFKLNTISDGFIALNTAIIYSLKINPFL